MQRKKMTVKSVLIMGVIVGISVIAISYFTLTMQHRRAVTASLQGTLPKVPELTGFREYAADREGKHHFVVDRREQQGSGTNVRAWSRLIYSEEGKKEYLLKRNQKNMFTIGFDRLIERNILFEFRCRANPPEYAVIEVYEIDDSGKTIDFGKTGSSKDWEEIPQGTTIEKLAGTVCPAPAR